MTNLITNQVVREIGKMESIRFLKMDLCRAVPGPNERLQGSSTMTVESEAAENPLFRRAEPDPMIVN